MNYENAIEVKKLTKKFGDYGVENINFSLPKGYVMGFVGKNGAGKTTTIKSILNLVNKDAGEIKVFGLDHLEYEAQIKSKLGIVMDSPFFEGAWTLKTIEKVMKPFYQTWDSKKYFEMLYYFNLDPHKKLDQLSRGMKMKIMIAVALAHDPDLLILDEPTSGLDAVARDELLEALKMFIINENKSILFSTHITSDLEKIADYITFINDGEIMHSDTKDNLLEKYVIIKGDFNKLSSEHKKLLIGYNQTAFGYDAMVLRENIKKLPDEIIIEPATLDDMVIRFNRRKNI